MFCSHRPSGLIARERRSDPESGRWPARETSRGPPSFFFLFSPSHGSCYVFSSLRPSFPVERFRERPPAFSRDLSRAAVPLLLFSHSLGSCSVFPVSLAGRRSFSIFCSPSLGSCCVFPAFGRGVSSLEIGEAIPRAAAGPLARPLADHRPFSFCVRSNPLFEGSRRHPPPVLVQKQPMGSKQTPQKGVHSALGRCKG